jgi:hypothetical protein
LAVQDGDQAAIKLHLAIQLDLGYQLAQQQFSLLVNMYLLVLQEVYVPLARTTFDFDIDLR